MTDKACIVATITFRKAGNFPKEVKQEALSQLINTLHSALEESEFNNDRVIEGICFNWGLFGNTRNWAKKETEEQ